MNIQTKFKLGQKVYIVFKEENEPYVKILDDVVEQIVIDSDGILYYGQKLGDDIKEEELISDKDINQIIPKIKELLKTDEVKNGFMD